MITHAPALEGSVFEAWRGASGATYPYTIIEIGRQPNTAFGNYIFAKRNRAGRWTAIFVGHGDLSLLADLDQHRMRDFIREQGATHVHIHENPWLTARMIERMDILQANPEAAANSHYQGTLSA